MVVGKPPVPGHPTIWITVGQGHISLAVGAGGGYLEMFTLFYPLVGWLAVLGLRPFETIFQSISSRLPKRGRKSWLIGWLFWV